MAVTQTYSFLDCEASIVGPGLVANIGQGAGHGEEGITTTQDEDKNTMIKGADGKIIHSLHATNSGQLTLNLMQGPINSILSKAFHAQTASSLTHGQNVITIRNVVSGDVCLCVGCAFKKAPDFKQAKDAQLVQWVFDCASITTTYGTGTPAIE